jgi:hypothetical protein
MADPFRPCALVVDYVDSVAGSKKTLTAINVALDRARNDGVKTIFAMPTLELIREMVGLAQDHGVPVVEITSRDSQRSGDPITTEIYKHLRSRKDPHLLFITHEALFRMGDDWPRKMRDFELVIDEAPEVILTRQPFKLRDNFWVLSSFLKIEPVTITRIAQQAQSDAWVNAAEKLDKKLDRLRKEANWARMIIQQGEARSSRGEFKLAKIRLPAVLEQLELLLEQRDKNRLDSQDVPDVPKIQPYSQVVVAMCDEAEYRAAFANLDDVYDMLEPLPRWLTQDTALFTDWSEWIRATVKSDNYPNRGQVTITGFRRPDALKRFGRVTIMSALFRHTMLYDVWTQLGVTFVPSKLVDLDIMVTDLGARRLRIYWLDDEGWSKRKRNRSGGISEIFKLIKQAGVIDENEGLLVITNKDDATEHDPRAVLAHFLRAGIMPHNSRGRNDFRRYHQLIHCAALNAYTPDIRWLEQVFVIDSHTQRIARTGQEIYQSLMRMSLRDPDSAQDVTLVVMDKDVAEWLVQWFSPAEQVEVIEINSTGVIRKKGKPGRPRLEKPATPAERQRRHRAKRAAKDANADAEA